MVSALFISMTLLAAAQPQETGRAPTSGRDSYLGLRAKTADTADAHWKLGLWCEQQGLKAEALIEFEAVTRLDPRREAAWKKLGYVKYDGRWMTEIQMAAEKAELSAQRMADSKWRPLLQKWKNALSQKNKRAEAEAALAAIDDPRATPAIASIFGLGTAHEQELAIDMLGHIEGEQSSRALATLAIFGKTDLVRRAAVETITRRTADDVLIAWIGLLRPPIKYEVRQVAGPGLPGVLYVEGGQYNFRRFYTPLTEQQAFHTIFNGPTPESAERPTQFSSRPPAGVPPDGSKCVGAIGDTALYIFDYTWAPPPPPPGPTQSYQVHERMVLQAQIDRDFVLDETAKMAEGAQAQLQQDVKVVEQANATIRERNARLCEALTRVAGVDLGEDRESWLKWWMKKKGYSYIPPEQRPKQTVNVQVPLPYVTQSKPEALTQGAAGSQPQYCMLWEHDKGQKPRWGKCFAAGTRVLTADGPRAIETLRPGDRVETAAGQTSSILSVHQSQAEQTLRLIVAGEATTTTEGHPFFKRGIGWTRAGDLRPGDLVETKSGQARVDAIEIGPGGAVWNLRLTGSSRFLVGGPGLVVHDLSPVHE